jgi:hypothetical protein
MEVRYYYELKKETLLYTLPRELQEKKYFSNNHGTRADTKRNLLRRPQERGPEKEETKPCNYKVKSP